MIYLEMNHVRKSFGDLEVLKDISLKVEEGEVLSIIGPSGSGKSTLLRCAAMLETMDGGDLAYLGKQAVTMENGKSVYAKPAVLRKIQENFGMVFQSFHLFPHYNVMKNLCDAPIHVQKRNRAEVEAQAEELLGKMGLTGKEKAYPCQLSGGQCQRVAIARALMLKPKVLFFDEPTSARSGADRRSFKGHQISCGDEHDDGDRYPRDEFCPGNFRPRHLYGPGCDRRGGNTGRSLRFRKCQNAGLFGKIS